jgi:hypothetical protein
VTFDWEVAFQIEISCETKHLPTLSQMPRNNNLCSLLFLIEKPKKRATGRIERETRARHFKGRAKQID